jgi:SAM-dependent methyltransferase
MDAERFLRDFHSRDPGGTEISAYGRLPNGANSYDLLASGWPADAQGLAILDLACGGGFLLDLIRRRQRVPIMLIGADMSGAELALARARLGDAAQLLEVRAQDIALPDASIDHAVCHLALMLMRPIEPVIKKLGALLKPGGSFAAIIPGESSKSESSLIFRSALGEAMQAERVQPIAIGDARTASAAGLADLFAGCPAFEPVRVMPLDLNLSAPPARLATLFGGLYPVARLSAAAKASLVEGLTQAFESLRDSNGDVLLEMPLLHLVARRSR